MRKIISLVLALAMLLTLCSVTAFAKDNYSKLNGINLIESKTITGENKDYGIKSGEVTWDSDSKTLTFNNVEMNVTSPDSPAVLANSDLTINFIGNNTITLDSNPGSMSALIQGSDSKSITIKGQNDARLKLEAGSLMGIQSVSGALTFEDIYIEYGGGAYAAFFVMNAPFTINNSTLRASGGSPSTGIYVLGGGETACPLTINNSDIEISTSSIAIGGDDITFNNSRLVLSTDTFTALYSIGDVTINDSECTIGGSIYLECGQKSQTFNMNSGELNVFAKDYPAIFSYNSKGAVVNINGGVTWLTVEDDNLPTILVKDEDGTHSKIDYSEVRLINEDQTTISYTDTENGNYTKIAIGSEDSELSDWHDTFDITPGIKSTLFADLKFTEGQDQTVKPGEGATFKLSLDNRFATGEVLVNGKTVDKSNYTISHGSTVVTFTKEYMDSLKPGTYTLTVKYNLYGTLAEESTTFIIEDEKVVEDESIADTADPTHVALTATIMCISAFGTAFVAKKRNEE